MPDPTKGVVDLYPTNDPLVMRNRRNMAYTERRCEGCRELSWMQKKQRFCSRACGQANRMANNPARGPDIVTRKCCIDICENPAAPKRKMCSSHYHRLQRYGDPLGWRGQQPGVYRTDSPAYTTLHHRVIAERGPASRCIIFQCDTGSTTFEWANISHEYKNTVDFMEMCKVHHAAHDGVGFPGGKNPKAKLTAERVKEIRDKYSADRGISYAAIGNKYGVGPVAIGRILREETWKEVA